MGEIKEEELWHIKTKKMKEKTRENTIEKKMKDPEYREEYNQRKAAQARRRYAKNSKYKEKSVSKYKRRKARVPWVIHYYEAKRRCNNPNRRDYKYYGGRGICMLLTIDQIEALYKRDDANQMERPSIDRIDNDKDYCFENCRFIEQSENVKRRFNQVK